MKISSVLLALSLIFTGCKQSDSPSSNSALESSGNIVFTFDKQNAPIDVKTVTTSLSRSNYPVLEQTINIDDETSATMIFERVAVGVWTVKIDAKNETGTVLYTGQSQVTVFENFVSQLNVTLNPVTTGVGTVQINVVWGRTFIACLDHWNNPLLTKMGTSFDTRGIGQPKIIYKDSMYRMYYLNNAIPSSVGYAESYNGIQWTRSDTLPILTVGSQGRWDDGGVGPGPVFVIGNMYMMLYQGYSAPDKHFQIGLATSSDGKRWVKHPTPVFTDSVAWEQNMMVASEVEEVNGEWYMYYCSGDKIGLAVSSDGFSWRRYSPVPIMTATQPWENGDISWVSIVKENDIFKMIYTNDDPYSYTQISFGYATSHNGVIWEKYTGNPIFSKSHTANNWAAGGIVYPYLTTIGREKKIFYTGITSSGEWKIGIAHLN
jgi:predicted GH43/DUF377 family glycosyl hydrolase